MLQFIKKEINKTMNTPKVYLLTFAYMGRITEVGRGSKAFLQYMRGKLNKQFQYKNGKLCIISQDGLKYNPKYAKA